ncbi:MAG TPA: hypothetical protein VF297_05085 [Pyrinomonadaceae bacterium]
METTVSQDLDRQAAALFEASVRALDGLNSWVRSKDYRHNYSASNGPMHAIYFYKELAIARAHALLSMSMRRVKSTVKCRGCGGTGRYVDSCGYEHNHCYDCLSSGSVTLYFVETEFSFGVKWHTPREKFPCGLTDTGWAWDRDAYEETDWRPNQPGKELPLEEVCRRLNTVETYFTERPKPYHWTRDWGSGVRDDAKYMLYVGETDARKCAFCGRKPQGHSYVVRRGRLGWRDHCCGECETRAGQEFRSVFDAFPVPEYLLEGEEVRKWMLRSFITSGELQPQKAPEPVPF